MALGYVRRRRACCCERRGADGTEVPVRIKRGPFTKLLGIGERGPHLRRRVGEVTDENERPLISVLADFSAGRRTRRVLFMAVHFFCFLLCGAFAILSRCCSRASTCFDQKR